MLAAYVMLCLATTGANPNWIGSVTSAQQEVVLSRQSARYAAQQGAGLQAGDRLQTSPSGIAAIYLYGEQVVYLGNETAIELHNSPQGIGLTVREGEVRITSSGQQPLSVSTRLAEARLERGIIRLKVDRYFHTLSSERGEIRCVLQQGQAAMLRESNEIRLSTGTGSVLPVSAIATSWTIDPARYRRAAEAESAENEQPSSPHGSGRCCPPRPSDTETPPEEPAEQPQEQSQDQSQQQQSNQQFNTTGFASTSGGSLGLGGFSGVGFGGSASAGSFVDANQSTLQGQRRDFFTDADLGEPFPGNIHIITGESRYGFGGVQLTAAEQAAIFAGGNPGYWSIGLGAPTTTQVITGVQTASSPVPTTVVIPRFGAYLVRLDQYGTPDPALDPAGAEANNVGTFGYLGDQPTAPGIAGAVPLLDDRARINDQATFAMGEFRLSPDGDGIQLAIRSSDQDRTIVKDPGGNDANDIVKTNPDLGNNFQLVADPRFLPAAPQVYVPERNTGFRNNETTFSNLNQLRRAAVTTLMADQLHDYARRTGQTRFVIQEADGRQRIIDISGYRRP